MTQTRPPPENPGRFSPSTPFDFDSFIAAKRTQQSAW